MADNPKIAIIDRQTGETKQVDAPSIADDFIAGKIGLQPGSTIPVVMDGEVGDVPAEKLYDALQAGWKIAGKQDILENDANNSGLRAAVEGGARALTFGGSDLVMRQAGADPEALQARAATEAAGIGEGTGMLAQAVYGAVGAGIEGTSIGARALQAAMKPTMLVDDLGRLAASRAESALTGMGLRAGAAKAIGMGVAGSVEGAVVGGMQGMSEAAMGDPEANAEVLLHAAAEGAAGGMLFGGGAGLALGGVASKLAKSRPLRETADEFTEVLRREGVDPESAPKSWTDKLANWIGSATTQGAEKDLAKVNNRYGQRVLAEGESAVNDAVKQMTTTLDDVSKAAKEVDDFTTQSRAKLVRDAIPKEAGDAAVMKIADVSATIRKELETLDLNSEMLGLGTKGGKQLGSKLEAAVNEAEERVFKAAGVEREYKAMIEVGKDSMGAPRMEEVTRKRTLEDLAGLYDNARPVAVAAHDALDNLRTIVEQATKGKSDDIVAHLAASRDAVKGALQDVSTFGDAARVHGLLEKAAVKRGEMQDYLAKSFRSEDGKIIPESVHNHIRSVLNVDADTALSKLRDFADSNKQLMTALHAAGADVSALRQVQGKLETFSHHVDSLEKPIRERVAVFNAARQLRNARSQSLAGASNAMSYGLGAAIHGATGLSGAPLALGAAGAFTALTDPARFAVNRARIGNAIAKRASQLNEVVNKLVTGGSVDKAVPRGSRLTAQMVTGKSYAERAEAFRQRIDQVYHAASPMGQQEREDAGKDFADAAPAHADALAAKQDLATRMLLASIPQPLATPGGLGLRPPTYPDSAIRRFARLDQAIQDPQSIIRDAMNGKVSHEARQVLHTLYPKLALTIQAQLMQEMGNEAFKLSPARERAIKLLLTPVTQNDMQRLTQLQGVITMPAAQPTGGSAPKASPTLDGMSAADQLLAK